MLGVLSLILLTQIGVIVGVGVLLDGFLVRTVVVHALVFLLGEMFWWPARPHYGRAADRSPEPGPVTTGTRDPAPGPALPCSPPATSATGGPYRTQPIP